MESRKPAVLIVIYYCQNPLELIQTEPAHDEI
jgi:hypothetical protein